MKVRQLKEILDRMNPDNEVTVRCGTLDGYVTQPVGRVHETANTVVIIEGNSNG